jgi:hypothetical protein
VVRSLLGCALVSIAAAACTADPASTPDDVPPPALSAAPVPLQPTPGWIADTCATVALLRRVCPAALPRGPAVVTAFIETSPGRPAEFSVESGGLFYGAPRRNRPPRYSHVAVRARHLVPGRAAAWLGSGLPRFRIRDAVGEDTGREELVGRRAWFGARGSLILTATRDLAYRWHEASVGYEMALHVWAPFRETVPTLRVLLGRTLLGAPPKPLAVSPEAPSDGLRWIETPGWVRGACDSLPRLRAACPRSIPLALSGFVEATAVRGFATCGGAAREDLLSVQWSAEDPRHPARNRPPKFMHLEVGAGSACMRWRFRRASVRPRPGMMRGRNFLSSAVVPLGRRTWAGRRGLLVLGDCYGNHLCFRWRGSGIAYQIDLHGWEPFPETVSVLRRIVSSAR